MTIKKIKTIYFIYNADGGLLNEIRYWFNKNILKKDISCELCDISHNKIFIRSNWARFIKELKKDFNIEVLHRNEIPKIILEKGFKLPCVIGKTEDELIELIDSDSLSSLRKTEGVKELSKKILKKIL
tara:strand:+ start:5205 stop:5588 length:384 start_codon:yes stop_codon:yes gene_type:complete